MLIQALHILDTMRLQLWVNRIEILVGLLQLSKIGNVSMSKNLTYIIMIITWMKVLTTNILRTQSISMRPLSLILSINRLSISAEILCTPELLHDYEINKCGNLKSYLQSEAM